MKITLDRADRAYAALASLDGKFEFGSEATWALAGTMVGLEDALRSYRRSRDMKIKELSKGVGRIDPETDPEAAAKFMAFDAELVAKEVEVTQSLTRQMLDLDKNRIPPATIAALIPLMKEV